MTIHPNNIEQLHFLSSMEMIRHGLYMEIENIICDKGRRYRCHALLLKIMMEFYDDMRHECERKSLSSYLKKSQS